MTVARLLIEAQQLKLLRPLDVQFALMVAQNDSSAAVMLAAALLSYDVGEGHVCLPLSRLHPEAWSNAKSQTFWSKLFSLAGSEDERLHQLEASPAITDGSTPAPMVLSDARLYLNRMWHNEQAIAYFFSQPQPLLLPDESAIIQVLRDLFPQNSYEVDWQKVAVAVALTRRISVISGGPGTGKTTTVAKLLAALIRLYSDKRCRIRLVAPTGKAAARLTESLGGAVLKLSLNAQQKLMLPTEAETLHRLLGVQPGSQRLRYHAGNPLHLDVLLVDETSMIDLPMMARLIDALPSHARIIFLGDRDQLASVEAGAVLNDICALVVRDGYSRVRAEELSRLTETTVPIGRGQQANQLRDSLCLLHKNYRFGENSGIGQLAQAVNNGDAAAMRDIFRHKFADISLKNLLTAQDYKLMLYDALAGYNEYLQLLKTKAEPEVILAAFSRYKLLCALREGPSGVCDLNTQFEQVLTQKQHINMLRYSPWYEGRPVMIASNDSALGLSNGDIGVMLNRGNGLRAWFPMPDGSIKSVPPSRLPIHNTAWTMTVHKSQGSEFEHVALILPTQLVPVLTRELVYTAITRAKKRVSIYADQKLLAQAIAVRSERRSGLAALFERLG